MNELIERLMQNSGVTSEQAIKAVAIILDFLLKEGPTDKVQALVDLLPGANEAVAEERASGGGAGGLLGGIMGGMGGVMGVANRLMGAGLNMGQVQSVTRELVALAREKLGEDAVNDIVGSVPGLAPFV